MREEMGKGQARARRIFLKELLFSVLAYIAFSIELKAGNCTSVLTNLISSFREFSLEHMMVFPMLFLLITWIGRKSPRTSRLEITPLVTALVFSFFMVFGRSFEETDSWALVIDYRNGQTIKAGLMFLGYTVFFYYLVCFVFDWLNRKNEESGTKPEPSERVPKVIRWYLRTLREKPFLTVFLTLLIASIPNMIISYPARLMGDTHVQVLQAYSELKTPVLPYFGNNLLKDGVYINQHHPAAHTLLIHACLVIGEALSGSLNGGFFLYVLLQFLLMTAAYAYACSVMVRRTGLSWAGLLLTVLYALIHPMIANYAFLVTKDTVYAALVMVCITNVFRLVSGEKKRLLTATTILTMMGIILFRNEGRYILYLLLPLLILLNRETRKRFACMLAAVVLFSACVFRLLYPALGFTPGSIREMLSVPFQQTARYVRDHGEEVTEEERETIDRVLAYNSLADDYRPWDRADQVKDNYRETATKEELADYFRIWAQMFRKHPGAYIQATMNNYYQYFYPGKARLQIYFSYLTDKWMDELNPALKRIGREFSRPSGLLEWLREKYDSLWQMQLYLPFTNLLLTPAVYAWVLLLLLFWTVSRRNGRAACVVLLPLLILAVCFVGPCNGYYGRYQFPFIFAMPAIIRLTVKLGDNRREASVPDHQ